MSDGAATEPSTPGQQRFDRLLQRRLRVANATAWMRAGGIQAVWLIVLVAGAAIPLSDALIIDGWTWVTPVLGLVIVFAAGLERIFRRTTDAAVPLDELRRNIARERRLLMASANVYGEPGATHALFAERVEAHIAEYDRQMVDYGRRIVGDEMNGFLRNSRHGARLDDRAITLAAAGEVLLARRCPPHPASSTMPPGAGGPDDAGAATHQHWGRADVVLRQGARPHGSRT